MRSLIIVAALAGSAAAQPHDAPTGWCPSTAAPARPPIAKRFEIDRETWRVKPYRTNGFESETVAYAREARGAGTYLGYEIQIANGKLELATSAVWCRNTGAGCGTQPNRLLVPRRVVFTDPVAQGACLDYAALLDDDLIAVGLGTEMRVYRRDSQRAIQAVATLATPRLELVASKQHHGPMVLQEATGPLWSAQWDGSQVKLAKVPGVTGRVISFAEANSQSYAFTAGALYLLDRKTLATRWQLSGEAWGVLTQDVPQRSIVAVVDRSKAKPRVVLRVIDPSGKTVRETVVYEGPAITAVRLGFSHDGRSGWFYVVHLSDA